MNRKAGCLKTTANMTCVVRNMKKTTKRPRDLTEGGEHIANERAIRTVEI